MKLYNYFRSSASYRVRIALALKGLAYDYRAVHLAHGEQFNESYAAISASRLVPVLLDWEVQGGPPVNLLFKGSARRTPRLRAFVDFALQCSDASYGKDHCGNQTGVNSEVRKVLGRSKVVVKKSVRYLPNNGYQKCGRGGKP